MNLNAKYDVFVSYSRKDYVDESKNPIAGSAVAALLDFLDKNEITYWFDKDGIYSGSEFVEVITDAITDSKMMIFVSSEYSNASPWTTGEIFEALEQEKPIVPFKIDNSPYNKKFRMMVRPLDFIEYFTNADVAFDSLLKAINICKDEYAKAIAEEEKRKAEENAKQRRVEILEEIKTESLDFQHHASTLAQDAQRLVDKQKLVGNKEKKCPVCSTLQPIETAFCKKCGWTFNPIFDAYPKGDKDHLFVMRSLWNAVHDTDAIRINLENKTQELESLRKEKDTLTATVQSLQQQSEAAMADAQQLSEQSKTVEGKLRNRIDEISQQLTATNTALVDKERKIARLEKSLSDAEATLSNVQKELKSYKDAEARRKAEEEAKRKAESAHHKAEVEAKANAEEKRKAAEAAARKKAEEEKKRGIIKVGNVEFKMIHVEGGTFTMGEESDAHQVTLSSYYIGETPVMQALWKEVTGKTPSRFNGDQRPVESVSWDDCQDFIKKLNAKTGMKFRLLTEAEWEFAARGGNKSKHTQYAGSNKLDEVAWYDGNSDYETHPVQTKNPNELGIYDMSGNVWEWCQDWYGDYKKGSQTNPTGPSCGFNRVFRGGSWNIDVRYCRLSYRYCSSPDYASGSLGFRLALSE